MRRYHLLIMFCSILLFFVESNSQIKIMCVGNSITNGYGKDDITKLPADCCYRPWLYMALLNWNSSNGFNFQFDFVGVCSTYSVKADSGLLYKTVKWDKHHEGYAGSSISGLTSRMGIDLPVLKSKNLLPQIVIFQGAYNSFWSQSNPTNAINDLRLFVEKVRSFYMDQAFQPKFIIMLDPPAKQDCSFTGPSCTPSITYQGIVNYNNLVPNLTYELSTNDSPLKFIDCWSNFNQASMLMDNAHPNQIGGQEMANRIFESVIGYVQCSTISAIYSNILIKQ